MPLPQAAIDYLKDNAKTAGLDEPRPDDDLFKAGILDSFSLVDFISLLENETGIKVPDSDVNPANFSTMNQAGRYVEKQTGSVS